MDVNESNVLDDKEAAHDLRVGIQTLRNWRSKRRGPAYLKLGRCVRYLQEDLDKFKRENRIDPRI